MAKTAVVTGASSGIGRAYAERLVRDGYRVVAVARRRERLKALASELGDDAVEVLVADLAKDRDLARVETRVAEEPSLELLVNNAGFGAYMPFQKLPPERAEDLVRVHVLAATRLARAALPGMLRRRRGAIVNVASMLGFSASLPPDPLPERVVYAACKAYLIAFSQALAAEIGAEGVRVQALCPGLVATEFHAIQDMEPPREMLMAPQDVVQASLRGLELGEVVCGPAAEDGERLRSVAEAGRAMFGARPSRTLAARYRS
jgi:short-subunit dehydrogenase